MIILYSYISQEQHQKMVDSYLSDFSMKYQSRLQCYKKWQDVQLSLLGRIMLIYGFKLFGQIISEKDIRYTPYGKPFVENSSIQFNITHSEDIVVCAIGSFRMIGIDVERIKPVQKHLFEFVFTKRELDNILKSDSPLSTFYNFWTRKEAALKAIGKGLHTSPNSFEVIDEEIHVSGYWLYCTTISIDDSYECQLALPLNCRPCSVKTIHFLL